jgi:hypothetical protein
MEYYDFDLWVDSALAQGYPLHATSETQGEAQGWMQRDPLIEPVLASLQRLEEGETDEAFLMNFGTLLYNLLFSGDIAALFEASLGEVIRQEEVGLRIRLRIAPPEISALPWEYLYVPRHRYFLGASRKTPLTRYLEVAQPIRALYTTWPLKVLVAIPGQSGLEAERKRVALIKATRKLRGLMRFRFLTSHVTRSSLSDALLEEQYHVFHFIGHGVFENDRGYLVFQGENGQRDLISDEIFARFFLDKPSMKLVILNACEGARVSSSRPMVGLAPKLVEQGIPAVIAHQYSLGNEISLRFTREFYRGLCTGTEAGHVDAAMAHARNQLSIHFPATPALGAPILFMRAPKGVPFDSKEIPPAERSSAHLVTRLSTAEREYLENLLATRERNRRVLEEQIYRMGAFVPSYLKAQLADEIAAIAEIKQKLGER